MGRSHRIILVNNVFLQENLLFPQVFHQASVILVHFLVKHIIVPNFPARRCFPTLLFASQGLIFSPSPSPSPSPTFSFRCCVTFPVRLHCLLFTWQVLTNSCMPVFHKGFPSDSPLIFIYLRGPTPTLRRSYYTLKYVFSHCWFIYLSTLLLFTILYFFKYFI